MPKLTLFLGVLRIRVLYTLSHMALIRIEDLKAAGRIDPPPMRAVRRPRVKN
jgi:hypothetical protein